MTDYRGKCAIVTGGGAGLGKAIALAFARAGANVVISGRRKEKLQETLCEIEAAGSRGIAVQADVSKRANAQVTIDAALNAFSRIDFLINNACATSVIGPIEAMTDELWQLSLNSGLGGTLFHMQAALPHLKESRGAIVNFGSRQGTHGAEGYSAYAATKEGIRGLSRVAAREFGPFGIRVNVVNPAAESDAASEYFKNHPGSREFYQNQAALRRFGKPDDIAAIVLFLCSDEADYMTGQTLNVDGGQVMF